MWYILILLYFHKLYVLTHDMSLIHFMFTKLFLMISHDHENRNCCRGLSTILASGNMTTYPTLCAKVTASFSVLSDTINAVKSSLDTQHNRRDITSVITQLQKSEGEKLNLTAALHLERLRLRNAELEASISGGGGDGSSSSENDARTVSLLKDGIQILQRKISGAVESINEQLEELRCIAADEQ